MDIKEKNILEYMKTEQTLGKVVGIESYHFTYEQDTVDPISGIEVDGTDILSVSFLVKRSDQEPVIYMSSFPADRFYEFMSKVREERLKKLLD